jgi:hypothetical protein
VSCLYPEASMARIIPGCAYENVSRRLLSDDQVFTKSMVRARASAGNGLFAARLLLCAPAHTIPPRAARFLNATPARLVTLRERPAHSAARATSPGTGLPGG